MEGWEGSSEILPLFPPGTLCPKPAGGPGMGQLLFGQPAGALGACHGYGLCVTDTYHCCENAQKSLLLLTETALDDGAVLI